MNMRMILLIVLSLSVALTVTSAQAEADCSNGTLVSVRGEIDNNAIVINHPGVAGMYTMGVADLRLSDGQHVVQLNCALFGEPTGITDPSVGYQYDHLIVCNDPQQSEIAFKSRVVLQSQNPAEVLKKSELENFCRQAVLGFVERNRIDSARQSKGMFQDAGGAMRAAGCLNLANDGANMNINMGVSGDLCLPNWRW